MANVTAHVRATSHRDFLIEIGVKMKRSSLWFDTIPIPGSILIKINHYNHKCEA